MTTPLPVQEPAGAVEALREDFARHVLIFGPDYLPKVPLSEILAAPQEAVERQPPTGWISVDERLPEENMPVLVTKDGGHEYIDLDVMEEGVWRDWCEYVEHVEVIGGRTSDVKLYTHWAPIPCGIGPATQEKQHG